VEEKMKQRWPVKLFFGLMLSAGFAAAQNQKAAEPTISPEMSLLAKMFVGDWNTVENMERSDFFPNGGGRHGTTHWKLGAGGTTLIGEGHSNGSAGELSYLIAIWWDKPASVYRFFTCFNDSNAPCVVRGTAHWEGHAFVNDYEETVKGEKRKCRDVFTQDTPDSRSLVAEIETRDGQWKALITTKSVRGK
jgi:hypothetical protein